MDLIAAVKFEGVRHLEHLGKRRGVCAISKRNLVAFSAPKCYKLPKTYKGSQAKSDDKRSATSNNDFGGVADTVFVFPLASPWEVHYVAPIEYEIKHITWDPSGTKLLVADASGHIVLWQMHESLVNQWMVFNVTKIFVGDDIIALKWISNSQQFTIAKDVREQVSYDKKFPLASITPSNGLFGGRSVDHWVAVTSSGVVGVGVVQHKTEMSVAKTLLEYYECKKIMYADICLEYDGSIQVVTSTGGARDPIRLHKLTTDISSHGYIIQSGSLSIECCCYSCFYPDKCKETDRINSIQYTQPLNGQSVLVSIDKDQGTEIQQWTQCEETLDLHTAFHQANPIIPERNVYWIRQTSLQLNSTVSATATFPLVTDNSSLFPTGAAFYCNDRSMKLSSRQSLNDMTSSPVAIEDDKEITALAISPNGCVCVALTNTCEVLIFGESNQTTESRTTLLEYSLLTGTGWEDVLTCVKSDGGMLEKVLQSLEASVAKQDEGFQNLLSNKLFMLKVSASLTNEGYFHLVPDYLSGLLIRHVKNLFTAVLSSSQYEEQELNAEERFYDIMNSMADETDIEKVISCLEPTTDFIPDKSVVPSLQPKVQWVCDLCITLMSSLPIYSIAQKTGSWLVNDIISITNLREMLAMIRLWYNTVPGLRPTLACSMVYDALAKLFKLLTTWLVARKKGELANDNLLDECSLLSTQIVLPPFDKSICWSRLPYSLHSTVPHVQQYSFGDEPESTPCLRVPFGQYLSNAKKDIFSHVEANNHSTDGFKHCVRCQAMTVLFKPVSDQMTRGNSISHYCICGGFWVFTSQ